MNILDSGFTRTKLGEISTYNSYATPSLAREDFQFMVEKLVVDANHHYPKTIACDYNT